MSKGKRGPRLQGRGKPVDRVVHPKAGRRNGEKLRAMRDAYQTRGGRS